MRSASPHSPRYVRRSAATEGLPCAWPGCSRTGLYPAPKSRADLREYQHFCLDHVRDYNSAWNFFDGMSQAEIETFRHEELTGHRPTWRLGLQVGRRFVRIGRRDPFRLFPGSHPDMGAPAAERPSSEECAAFDLLGLDLSATLAEIKARFKELVRRHHPDANDGDKAAGERLRVVIQAYRLLARRRTG
jgi:hypothetical protein